VVDRQQDWADMKYIVIS